MKTIISLVFALVFLSACTPEFQPDNLHIKGLEYDKEVTIVTIDSCEYLIGYYDRSAFLTHKGNCKNHKK